MIVLYILGYFCQNKQNSYAALIKLTLCGVFSKRTFLFKLCNKNII